MANEHELALAAAAGDPDAFAALAGPNRPRALAVAERMLGSREEAEDVVQEALLRAYLGLSGLRDATRFGGWLCGIAVNLAKMRLRQRATHARAVRAAAALDGEVDAFEERLVLSLVRDAVEVLPRRQRDAVLMHYVDGLSCDEIAALLGSSPGAVRVRLHRARAQLREELAVLAPPVRMRRELPMVEMKVDDVLVLVADDDPTRAVTHHRIVVLKEKDGPRVLAIWTGTPEGDALVFNLHRAVTPRPLTTDLMASLVRASGGRVERVSITSLREKTFYAAIAVATTGAAEEVDARPSDAINLAVRTGAPIFAPEDVLAEAAISRDELPAELEKARERGHDLPAGRWASLSMEMLLDELPAGAAAAMPRESE